MKISEIYAFLEELAPLSVSDELCAKYGFYDNSGLLVGGSGTTEKILFSLDLSQGAIERAERENAALIVTHHPAIYGGLSSVTDDGAGSKIAACLKRGISVVSMHLNLDATSGGIDECLSVAVARASGSETPRNVTIMQPVAGGGYGRAYDVTETTLSVFAEGLSAELKCKRLAVYGKERKKIRRVASFCGAGGDEKSVAFAVEQEADAIVSADFKHHVIAAATERGLAIVQPTHYASEVYGFRKYYQKIRQKTKLPCVFHKDELY